MNATEVKEIARLLEEEEGVQERVNQAIADSLGYQPMLTLKRGWDYIELVEEDSEENATTRMITGNKLLRQIFKRGYIRVNIYHLAEFRALVLCTEIRYRNAFGGYNGSELERIRVNY